MNSSLFKKTAIAAAVAGAFGVTATAEANVVNVSWTGAFTMLNPAGAPVANSPSDYAAGYYANGGPGYGPSTTHGWYGNRTPITGTMSFDTSTGAGVATVTPFFFFGDTPGTGPGTNVASALGVTFQVVDQSAGLMVGSMLFSWNGLGHSVSIVLDASGMFANIGAAIGGGPTSTISGVGALPATDSLNFGTAKSPLLLPLGPSPAATTTFNTAAGCDGLTLATQTNAHTIVTNGANVATCVGTGLTSDGIGGDPMSSTAFSGFNANFDITSVHFDSFVPSPVVPVPAAVWLFGSGLAGLAAIGRRRQSK